MSRSHFSQSRSDGSLASHEYGSLTSDLLGQSVSNTSFNKQQFEKNFPALHYLLYHRPDWEAIFKLLQLTEKLFNNRNVYRKENFKGEVSILTKTYREWWTTLRSHLNTQDPTIRHLSRFLRDFLINAVEEPAHTVPLTFVSARTKHNMARKMPLRLATRNRSSHRVNSLLAKPTESVCALLSTSKASHGVQTQPSMIYHHGPSSESGASHIKQPYFYGQVDNISPSPPSVSRSMHSRQDSTTKIVKSASQTSMAGWAHSTSLTVSSDVNTTYLSMVLTNILKELAPPVNEAKDRPVYSGPGYYRKSHFEGVVRKITPFHSIQSVQLGRKEHASLNNLLVQLHTDEEPIQPDNNIICETEPLLKVMQLLQVLRTKLQGKITSEDRKLRTCKFSSLQEKSRGIIHIAQPVGFVRPLGAIRTRAGPSKNLSQCN